MAVNWNLKFFKLKIVPSIQQYMQNQVLLALRDNGLATSAHTSSSHPTTHLPGLLADFRLVLSLWFMFYIHSPYWKHCALPWVVSSQTPGETQRSSVNGPACTLPQTASFQGGGAKGLHAVIPSTGTHTCRSQAAEDAVPLGFCFCLRGSYSLATD